MTDVLPILDVEFVGGPYAPYRVPLSAVSPEIRLTWKDTDEVAGVYEWDPAAGRYVWRQLSDRPANPLTQEC